MTHFLDDKSSVLTVFPLSSRHSKTGSLSPTFNKPIIAIFEIESKYNINE